MKDRIIHFSVTMVGFLIVFLGIKPVIASGRANVSENDGPLKVLKIFKAGSGTGFFDYLKVDSRTNRLFISHSTQVEVIDANDGTHIDTITDTPGVHGIALVPDSNEVYTTNGRENKLGVFDMNTLKPLRKVNTGQNPDAIIYDPATKKIFSFNHSGGNITVVDITDPDKAPVTIQVGGTLESGVSDLAGHVYVNVEDKSEIVVIDSKQDTVLAHWPLAPGEEPTGMAIDREHHRLYAGCGNQMMVVVDAIEGKVLVTVPIGSGCDGVIFEPSLGLVVCSNGRDGTATVVKEEPTDTFKVVQTLSTARGARTITCDPVSHLIYLPCNIMSNGQNQFSVLVVGSKMTEP